MDPPMRRFYCSQNKVNLNTNFWRQLLRVNFLLSVALTKVTSFTPQTNNASPLVLIVVGGLVLGLIHLSDRDLGSG